MKTSLDVKQFNLCEGFGQQLVILTNTLFNDVDSILVATVNKGSNDTLITGLQIPVVIENTDYFVDLLDIATISKQNLKIVCAGNLQEYRADIKAGLDLLIDGF